MINQARDFFEISSFVPKKLSRMFWANTTLRLMANFFDIAALALIWYTTSGIVNGAFSRVEIMGFEVIRESSLDEFVVALLGVATVSLFVIKSLVGLLMLGNLRDISIGFEVGIAKNIIGSALNSGLGGNQSGRKELPRVQNALNSTRAWVAGSVTSFSVFLSEIVLVVLLIVAMALSNFLSTLIMVTVLGASALFLQRKLSKLVREEAANLRHANRLWVEELTGALSSKSQIRIRGKASQWIEGLTGQIHRASHSSAQNFYLNSIPRFVLEFAVLISVALVLGGSFLLGDFVDNAPGAAVVLAGAFRISSAILPIQSSISRMVFGRELAKAAKIMLAEIDDKPQGSTELQLLESKVLNFVLGNGKKNLVIQGPSGIGKTTSVLRALDSEKIRQMTSLGFLGQDPSLVLGDISRNVTLDFKSNIELAKPEIDEIAVQIGAEKVLERFTSTGKDKDSSVITLSGGELTKLELLRAHFGHPSVVILDEPTSGLDKKSVLRLTALINSSSIRYVIISHDDDFIGALEDIEKIQVDAS